MYIETSNPRVAGDKARLLSPLILRSVTGNVYDCVLEFWYHMYGDDGLGTLNVYLAANPENSELHLLWTKAGNQGNEWHLGRINFTWIQSEKFKV